MNTKRINARAELRWLHQDAHAALGISSCHGSVIRAAFGFSSADYCQNTVEDAMLDRICRRNPPIKKLRAIQNALSRMTKQERRMLDALYGGYTFGPELRACFGEATGISLFTIHLSSLKELSALCTKRIQGNLTPEERSLFLLIEKETEALYRELHLSYQRARGASPDPSEVSPHNGKGAIYRLPAKGLDETALF